MMGERFYLRRVHLSGGGYDSFGRYWGIAQPLFQFWNEPAQGEGCKTGTIRAADRAEAKAVIAKHHAGARFFR